VETTRQALDAGIAAAVPGNRIGDVAHAIGRSDASSRLRHPEGWGGHGVGRSMHEDPSVPNEGHPGAGSCSSRAW
jgi:methionyl aminopeptidase